VCQEERSTFWEVILSVIVSGKKLYIMCRVPNGFRDRAISLYISKIVDNKEILRIYCSSDKVGTVYLVKYIFENSTLMHFATRVRTWRVARLYSVQCTVQRNCSIPETVRNRTHAHIHSLLRTTDTVFSQNIDLLGSFFITSSGTVTKNELLRM
jgi:hypothetical protein